MDFSKYKFRAHSVGKIMGGVPRVLTQDQESTYNSLLAKHKSNNKNLTLAQMKRYAYLINKHKDVEKELTENQKNELFDLILKYESTGKNLTLNQISTLGDLHKKKTGTLKLDDTAKSFLEKLVWQELTKRSSDIKSAMIDKGLRKEEESITLYSNVTNKLFLKNEERKQNEYLSGEYDNSQNETIRDIKTSWSYESFPLRDDKIKNKDYIWQLDSYMDLWGFKKSELIYCLVDTPFNLLEDEIRSLDYHNNILTQDGQVREERIPLVVELVSNHIYTSNGLNAFCQYSSIVKISWFLDLFVEIPEEIRIKIFEHKYCEIRNTQMKEMVLLAREYMNFLIDSLGDSILKFNKLKSV